MEKLIFHKAFFLKSGLHPCDWVECNGMEVAFLGYSNVGKSSVINALTNQKKLAYVSKSPGRTQLINFFEVIKNFRLIDLPGYGYSKIKNKHKNLVNNSIMRYLQYRVCLKGIILLTDIRFPLKALDFYILKIINKRFLPIIILLTKSDKISMQRNIIQYNAVHKKLTNLRIFADLIIFSSIKKIGIVLLQKKLLKWWRMFHKSL